MPSLFPAAPAECDCIFELAIYLESLVMSLCEAADTCVDQVVAQDLESVADQLGCIVDRLDQAVPGKYLIIACVDRAGGRQQ